MMCDPVYIGQAQVEHSPYCTIISLIEKKVEGYVMYQGAPGKIYMDNRSSNA